MVEHAPEGALGLVLNTPTRADVAEVLPEWASLACAPDRVFVGGPVALDHAVIGFARVGDPGGGERAAETEGSWQQLLGPVGTVDLGARPSTVSPSVEAV